MSTLTGKIAIVTGGGQGVGRGIALALATEGAYVVVAGRTASTLEGVCGELRSRGVEALGVVCDVARPSDLAHLVEQTIGRFGTVDILVNNAALIPHGSILDIDETLVQAAWEAGPMAALRLMRLCHPHLRGGGAVVNVSSGVAVAAHSPNRGIYAATKASLNAISRAAANEWGADGIRVNVIMPFALTDAVDRFFTNEPEFANSVLAEVPLGRVGDPETDIGRAVAFLVGPNAAYMTGATLPLDGGSSYIR
jgi:meso-butanediol dehydrogenase/(S,S)-butanediol dehydrogenase/diacetyl reductase